MLSTQRSINDWPPCNANTAEKSAEPTNSQHTIAVVFAVRNVASLMFCRSSGEVLRFMIPGTRVPKNVAPRDPDTSNSTKSACAQPSSRPPIAPARLHHQQLRGYFTMTARYIAPRAPTAADSVAVQMPNKITASTTMVSTPNGTTEAQSSLRISNCSPSMRQKYMASRSAEPATNPQNH